MRTQAQPDHLGHAVRESRLRCDRSVQRGIEDRAPAGDGSQILVARFPRSITQEAVLVHLGGTRLPHGAQLWRLNSDGIETLVALFDADGIRWRKIGSADA